MKLFFDLKLSLNLHTSANVNDQEGTPPWSLTDAPNTH